MTDGNEPSDDDDVSSVASLRLAAKGRTTSLDPRTHAAWRTWLTALATNADAATAAALAYQSLNDEGRDAWLDALEADAPSVDVPAIALYAPLLAVEQDDERRLRIAQNVTSTVKRSTPPRALVGWKNGERDIGAPMVDCPLPQVVEELAHAVVADRRAGRDAPPALMRYIDLFAPDLPAAEEAED